MFPPPLHPLINTLIDTIRFIIILIIRATRKQPNLVLWVLKPPIIVIVVFFFLIGAVRGGWSLTESFGASRESSFDGFFGGTFARWANVGAGGEAGGTATKSGDVVGWRFLLEEVALRHGRGCRGVEVVEGVEVGAMSEVEVKVGAAVTRVLVSA